MCWGRASCHRLQFPGRCPLQSPPREWVENVISFLELPHLPFPWGVFHALLASPSQSVDCQYLPICPTGESKCQQPHSSECSLPDRIKAELGCHSQGLGFPYKPSFTPFYSVSLKPDGSNTTGEQYLYPSLLGFPS